jgi:hypothetical protein
MLFAGSLTLPAFGQSYYEGISNISNEDFIADNMHLTRPTFGLSHQTNEIIVENGFSFNGQSFDINDNHHTAFAEQTIEIGKVNSFEAITFSPENLRVQEFLFGIPNKGEAHLAELAIEVWFNFDGEIKTVKTIQDSKIIDSGNISVIHEKAKCRASDFEKKCDTTKVSIIFLEPLKDKVMAIKAIDYKNRYQTTYLNEGFGIKGASLNLMSTVMIPSPAKFEGLISVTQIEKYNSYWVAQDGRLFERNDFGSFKQINHKFERFQDNGEPLTRHHSGFGGVLKYENERALNVFNATSLLSQVPDSFSHDISVGERITDEMKNKMEEQEQIAQKSLEYSVQARFF